MYLVRSAMISTTILVPSIILICNVDEIDTSATSRHQSSYCHIKRNTQHSISRSYYLYYSPPQHNSDPNNDTALHPC